jgi:hypothetical protein
MLIAKRRKRVIFSGPWPVRIRLTGVFTGFFIGGLALDDKSLSDVRKVQIAVEFGCGPDFADFDAAVIRWVAVDKIGVLAVFKI